MPFRDAHEVVGKSVAYCLSHGATAGATMEERRHAAMIDEDIYDPITLEASVNARRATGGTVLERVMKRLNE
jgi:argininosuccinate lyase